MNSPKMAQATSKPTSPSHLVASEVSFFEMLIIWIEEVAEDVFQNIVQRRQFLCEIAWAWPRRPCPYANVPVACLSPKRQRRHPCLVIALLVEPTEFVAGKPIAAAGFRQRDWIARRIAGMRTYEKWEISDK
ncbi:hypothetical protein [Rhizobium sp. N4311]|uniref:hypothetical protein n=1 Tax=Rhizobium sp. N4311 TaxID=1703972 RepID=UPI00117A1181|nr:hypothetical protein [Rhizobium sp. N4311]